MQEELQFRPSPDIRKDWFCDVENSGIIACTSCICLYEGCWIIEARFYGFDLTAMSPPLLGVSASLVIERGLDLDFDLCLLLFDFDLIISRPW